MSQEVTNSWALFKGDEQISKTHSSRDAVVIEAYEKGLMLTSRFGVALAYGYEIREVS